MTKLAAPVQAQRAHRKKARAGAFPDPIDPAQTCDPDTLRTVMEAGVRALVRERRASLEVQANPLAHRPTKPKVFPSEPTPEMRARYPLGWAEEVMIPGAGPVKPLNRHRPKRVIEVYATHFSQEERDIFAQVTADAESASAHRLTMNYGGTSGGGQGARTGGVAERDQARYTRFQMVVAKLTHVEQRALKLLVLEIRSEGMDTLPPPATVARSWIPTLNHEPTLRGAAIMALKCLAARLLYIYAVDAGSTRRTQGIEQ